MPRTHPPSAGEIDIWLADVSAVTAAPDVCLSVLDDSELARYHRLRIPASRIEYAVAHFLLRTTLSRHAGIAASDWRFETDAYGRPSVLEPRAWRHLQFNLSHTDGLVACAVGVHCRLGLDVENILRPVNLPELARYALAVPEIASLDEAAESARHRLFFQYWTLKESYMKADGRGLSIPLDAVWFDLSQHDPVVVFSDRCCDDPQRWQFRSHAIGEAYQLAVAVSAPTSEIDVRLHWAPGFSTPSADSPRLPLPARTVDLS